MRQRGYSAAGGSYIYRYAGGTGRVTRPDETTGTGGGDVISLPVMTSPGGAATPNPRAGENLAAELSEEFSDIRSYIDRVFAPWENALIAGDFERLQTDCSLLVAYMMGAVTESPGTFTGTGELGSKIALLNSDLTYFWGGAFEDFKQRYITDTGSRAVRLTALSEVLGQAVAAEKEVWAKVEVDLGAIADKYKTEFDKVADGGSGSADLSFAVIGAALAGVGLFATGVGATVVAGVGIALSLTETIVATTAAPEDPQSFTDAASGLSALRSSVDALSDRVHDEAARISATRWALNRPQ